MKLFPYDIGCEPPLEPPDNAPDPDDIIDHCACCGEPILRGDTYFALLGCAICEACMDDSRRYA